MQKQSSPGWGGRREGAGRPAGSRNAPVLLDLPQATDPMEWLLELMNHEAAPMRLRVSCAVALLPYAPEITRN
jgi:hypothetical protein